MVSEVDQTNVMTAEFVAAPDAASAARRTLHAFLSQIGWPRVGTEDLVLAVSEAVTNAAQHAYPNAHPGPITLRAHVVADRHHQRRVRVCVTDRGRWRPRPQLGNHFGVSIMQATTAHLSVDTDPIGTRVAMISAVASTQEQRRG